MLDKLSIRVTVPDMETDVEQDRNKAVTIRLPEHHVAVVDEEAGARGMKKRALFGAFVELWKTATEDDRQAAIRRFGTSAR